MGECIKFGRGKLQTLDPVFANNDWSKIISACQSGRVPDTWAVGDQKAMTINGTDYLIDIIGINHDDYADGSGKAPLTFQLHDCYVNAYSWHNGNSDVWASCSMRASTLPGIMSLMPSEVQSGIREVSKKTCAGAGNYSVVTNSEKLFLLGEIELRGSASLSLAGEGNQYDYYKSNSRLKKLGTAYSSWWLRSPAVTGYNIHVCFVDTNGNGAITYSTATSGYGVAPAFCF